MDWGREQDHQTGDEALEGRIKRLILAAVTKCNACRRRYTLDDFAVVGHRDHLWMVTVVCEGCRTQGFITAVVQGRRPLTTSTPDERGRQSASPSASTPLTIDDLLDLHDFLDDFDGDFAALFAGNRDK
ncbi:MAG: hypothetical protein M3Q65_22360 [Chloroflexota bacterium]|nr:hypothetical protein [Chloroflexota bacterium]